MMLPEHIEELVGYMASPVTVATRLISISGGVGNQKSHGRNVLWQQARKVGRQVLDLMLKPRFVPAVDVAGALPTMRGGYQLADFGDRGIARHVQGRQGWEVAIGKGGRQVKEKGIPRRCPVEPKGGDVLFPRREAVIFEVTIESIRWIEKG